MNRRRVMIVTGSRADYGLLRPVIVAARNEAALDVRVVAAGSHLVGTPATVDDVARDGPVAARVTMQLEGASGRVADAAAVGRGISAFTELFAEERADVVLVLGDRIEAFAAATAAAISGVRVAHMHGGDRAEGVADESLRHAISKLAHIHLPATARSAERLIAMGEEPIRTHLVGSPAVDGLADIPPMDDESFDALGAPEIVLLKHPTGAGHDVELARALALLDLCSRDHRVLALEPNLDPGRDAIMEALDMRPAVRRISHLDREQFVGLLRRCKVLVGNSSAGLIECAVLGVRCLDVGDRQAGRERARNVVRCGDADDYTMLSRSLDRALGEPMPSYRHPYGDGQAGPRVAHLLATFDSDKHAIRKQNVY